jgi:hypothetical protein
MQRSSAKFPGQPRRIHAQAAESFASSRINKMIERAFASQRKHWRALYHRSKWEAIVRRTNLVPEFLYSAFKLGHYLTKAYD